MHNYSAKINNLLKLLGWLALKLQCIGKPLCLKSQGYASNVDDAIVTFLKDFVACTFKQRNTVR